MTAWSYGGQSGPAYWGGLDAEFSACAAGRKQSPIDLPSAAGASPLSSVALECRATPGQLVHTGHTVQVSCPGGNTLAIDGKAYELAQFHFHTPSEHLLTGQAFGLELHAVHRAADGALAVLGVLFRTGEENPFLARYLKQLPHRVDDVPIDLAAVDLGQALPAARSYFTYEGSLTTPPCSEGVRWLVMQTPVGLSAAQEDAFSSAMGGNARPVQPLNGRAVGAGELAQGGRR
jgi:carbonic anhydrase